ncbi:hypothetical protein ACLB2K_074674 [Fragaria x ananassa]
MATTKLVLPLLLLLRLASPTSAAEFCVAKPGVSEQTLQANIFYACAQPGVDCSPIQPGNVSCNFGQSGSGSNPPPAGSGAPKPLARGGKKWCMAKQQARVQDLQANLNFVCDNQGVDCGPI